MKKNKKIRWVLFSIVLLLVIGRLVLPYFVLKYVNRQLSSMKGHYGHVEDIDIWLIRGAYVINDIKIWEKDKNSNELSDIPLLDTKKIDLSIEWKAILKGSLVGEIEATSAKINFVNKPPATEKNDLSSDTTDFRQLIKSLMPLKINRFEITDGELHYIDNLSQPKLDVAMKNIYVLATNLTNVNDSAKLLPSRLIAEGSAYDGTFNLAADLNVLERYPTFDMNARLEKLNLVKLNDFLQAYANVDVKKGQFSVYTEVAAKNAKYKGYVKPLMSDLDVVQWKKEEGDLKQIAWETLVASGAEVIQNQRKDQVATKLPLEGNIVTSDKEIGIWKAIVTLLKNGFIRALSPAIDSTIDIGEVNKAGEEKKGVFEKLFDGKKEKKKKDK